MPVERAFDCPKQQRIFARQRPRLVRTFTDDTSEIAIRGIHNGHGMSLTQDQTVGCFIPRILRIPFHLILHQHRNEVSQRKGGGRMAAACCRRHFNGELAQLDRLCVDCLFV